MAWMSSSIPSTAAEYLMRYRSLFKSILSLSMLVQSLLNEVLL